MSFVIAAARGRDRFDERVHSLLPRKVHVWQTALERVDFSRPAPDDRGRLGLWLPEAEFLVTPSSPLRLYAYLSNWLNARSALYQLLARLERFVPPRANTWRNFLGRFPEQTSEERQQSRRHAVSASHKERSQNQRLKREQERGDMCKFFSTLLKQDVNWRVPLPDHITWAGLSITLDSLKQQTLPEAIAERVREIAWEISEIAFRVELYELDRHLVPPEKSPSSPLDFCEMVRRRRIAAVFADRQYLIPTPPHTQRQGFFSPDVRDRAEGLESLRRLMVRWPRHPPMFDTLHISLDTPRDTIQLFERDAAEFYVQQFYEMSGRAAVVPRMLPRRA